MWTCIGTEPGQWAPIIQLPVDSDPPLAYGQVLPSSTLADYIASIISTAGFLADANVWTAVNTFSAGMIVDVALETNAIRGLTPGSTINMGWSIGNNFAFSGSLWWFGNSGGTGSLALGPTWSVAGTATLPTNVPYFVKQTSGGSQTITLPASPVPGQTILIFQAAIGTLTIIAPGGGGAPLINGVAGATGVTISSQYSSLTFYWDVVDNQWWAWS